MSLSKIQIKITHPALMDGYRVEHQHEAHGH